jgi:hypothetical protein
LLAAAARLLGAGILSVILISQKEFIGMQLVLCSLVLPFILLQM